MSAAEMFVMSLNDKIQLLEQHVDQVVAATGMTRLEAYRLSIRQCREVGKRLGMNAVDVMSLADDGARAELGK